MQCTVSYNLFFKFQCIFARSFKIQNKNKIKNSRISLQKFTIKARLDYQPLFGKMSPHSSPERVSFRGGSKTGPGRRRKSSLNKGLLLITVKVQQVLEKNCDIGYLQDCLLLSTPQFCPVLPMERTLDKIDSSAG